MGVQLVPLPQWQDDEIKAAAEYFSSMKWTPWIKVVETNNVPKTRIQGGMFLRLEGNDKEPLGKRIVEAPDNTEGTELLRDSRSGFTAYVPVGSLKRGEALVSTGGGGKTTACGQQGTRHGGWTDLMKPVVAKLTADDMVAIAAYTSSRPVGTEKNQITRASR